CEDEELIPNLVVRGAGYFGGMEYMFKRDCSFLKKHPAMCEQVNIPDGTYSARVYRTKIPDDLYDAWLLSRVGARAKRFWGIHSIIAACAVASVFVLLISFCLVTWTVWFCEMAVATILLLAVVAMSRTGWYKSVAGARDAFSKTYPSYVLHLE